MICLNHPHRHLRHQSPPPIPTHPTHPMMQMNERKWLARMIYLETVAGVPGMVAGPPAPCCLPIQLVAGARAAAVCAYAHSAPASLA